MNGSSSLIFVSSGGIGCLVSGLVFRSGCRVRPRSEGWVRTVSLSQCSSCRLVLGERMVSETRRYCLLFIFCRLSIVCRLYSVPRCRRRPGGQIWCVLQEMGRVRASFLALCVYPNVLSLAYENAGYCKSWENSCQMVVRDQEALRDHQLALSFKFNAS